MILSLMGSILLDSEHRMLVRIVTEHGVTSTVEVTSVDIRVLNEGGPRRIVVRITARNGDVFNIVAPRMVAIVACDAGMPTDIVITCV